MENKELNIYERLSLATEKIDKVAKNLKVGIGNSQYKAVGEADVLAAVKPIEKECRIYSYPIKRELVSTNEFTTTSEYNGTTKEKLTIFLRIKTIYRFVNIDNPTDFIDVETFGDGVDAQDKAPGKAMTYADKYALLKAYKIETGEDPDQSFSKDMKKISLITDIQIQELQSFNTNIEALVKFYKKKDIKELTFIEAENALNAKRKEYIKNNVVGGGVSFKE